MGPLLLVGVVLVLGAIAFSVAAALISMVVWLVLLPFRIVFFAIKLIFLTLAGAIGFSLLLVLGVIAAVAFGLVLLAPALPLLLIVGLIWMLARAMRRRPANA